MNADKADPFPPLDLATETFEALPLAAIADRLMGEPTFRETGKNARTLTMGEAMSAVLTVIRKGMEIREHEAPGPVTLIGISGKASLSPAGDGEPISIQPGTAATFSAHLRHSVRADEDSAFLIVIGGRVPG